MVKENPKLKQELRNIYQLVFDIQPKKNNIFNYKYDFAENYFFGFHDIDPFSLEGTKLLANHTLLETSMPVETDELIIGFFEIEKNRLQSFIPIGSTFSWNFHKGCRLQWLNNNEIIYNNFRKKLISEIINIKTKLKREISFPIDTVNNDGTFATSYSYQRLEHCMPGYGYIYADNGYTEIEAPKDTGLFLIDIKNNTRKMLFSINDLLGYGLDNEFHIGYKHFVTHSEFSFDGRYVSCLHRWIHNDINKRWTRLVIYDILENKIQIMPTQYMVSHYVWNSQNKILAYCRYDNIDSHVLYDLKTNSLLRVSFPTLNSDGHQSFIGNDNFISDTYPDKYRMSKLFIGSTSSSAVKLVASLFSPKKYQTKSYYNHIACDLHPRISSNNSNLLSFDSACTGKRSVYIMYLE